MALIQCKSVALGYDGIPVATDISFEVVKGDYLCIVGENGSGKSTLMKTLLGLQAPLSGEITFGDGLHKNEIGYLPQQTAVQRDFPATVREVVLSGCLTKKGFKPFYSRADKERVVAHMQRLGITDLAGKCYRELSGGQQQRVLLARALCAAERVILLDEPVTGLDPYATAEMYALIRNLNEQGITVIMISHDIGAALTYASHVLHMGNQCFFGTKQQYEQSDVCRALAHGNAREGGDENVG